jgi:hypothetical protein
MFIEEEMVETGRMQSFEPPLEQCEIELLREWRQGMAALMGGEGGRSNGEVYLNKDAIAAVARAKLLLGDSEFAALMKSLA